jgi:hypothetical protein
MSEERPETLSRHSEEQLGSAELRYRDMRLLLSGRTLRLVLWIAARQSRLNGTAPECGQLWLTWKGEGERSITGDIRTTL